MNELKKCPFCDGKAELVNYGLTGKLEVVQCLDCGARTRVFDPDIKRGESAIEAWNRRATYTNVIHYPYTSDLTTVQCPNCKRRLRTRRTRAKCDRFCPDCGQKICWEENEE